MTANQLIRALSGVSWKLGTEDLPVRINGEVVDITEVTLEDNEGTQWCDIKTN